MKRLIFTISLVAALAIGLTAVEIKAQAKPDDSSMMMSGQPMDQGMHRQGAPGFGPVPQEFERLRMKKLFELLQLDDDKQERLREIAKDFRFRMMTSVRELTAIQDTLATGLREKNLSDAEIERLVSRLEDMESERANSIATFDQQARDLLTLKQYALLLVFEQRFEREVFERMMQRRGRGMGPHPGPPGMEPFDPDSIEDEDSL